MLAFLTSEESLTLPNKIEEVNARQLERITREEIFVTVLFFDDSKDSKDALSRLEHIDDEADIFKIRCVSLTTTRLYFLLDICQAIFDPSCRN